MKKPTEAGVAQAQATAASLASAQQHVCPNCGYCPCCGRSTSPPVYPRPFPYPYPRPYWYGGTQSPPPRYPTITCSVSSNGTLH